MLSTVVDAEAFTSVDVDEVCELDSKSDVEFNVEDIILLAVDVVVAVAHRDGLLFLSMAGDCSNSEQLLGRVVAGGVGLGGTAVAVGRSNPLLLRCSTT